MLAATGSINTHRGAVSLLGLLCAAARRSPLACAWDLHRGFADRRLSPGGCADLLAAACWLHRLGALH